MIFYISKTYNPVFVKKKREKKLRIVASFDRKFFCREWRVNFNFLNVRIFSIRFDPTFSSLHHPSNALVRHLGSAQIFQTRVPFVPKKKKQKKEKKRKRWSNPTKDSSILPFPLEQSEFLLPRRNSRRRGITRGEESEHVKRIDITRCESVARYRSEGISVPLRGCFATRKPLWPAIAQRKCVARLFVLSCRPVHQRVDNHRAVIARRFSSIEKRPRDSHRDPNFPYKRDPS